MEVKAISVSTFNKYIASVIDGEELLTQVGVYGEIVDLKINKNIAFFGLKDSEALLNCVCFFEEVFSFLKNGKEVTLIGAPQYYVKGGKLTFKVYKAIETGNSGINYLKFVELKEKLKLKGYFDEGIKKPLKFYNKNIGIVASEKGAVIRDIISVCKRRDKSVNLSLFNVSVQGTQAALEIARGIEIMDKLNFDCIIVARGGGSGEDLSCFNEEVVADAIYNAKTPIISAVGHETDTTICDYCADLRAPTPSVAAELVTKDINFELNVFKGIVGSIHNLINQKLENFDHVLRYDTRELKNNFNFYLNDKIRKVHDGFTDFKIAMQNELTFRENNLDKSSVNFYNLNPTKILELGYAKVTKGDRCVNSSQINVGDKICVEFIDGKILAKVEEK